MKHNFKVVCERNPDVPQKPYTNVVKNILLYGTRNNAVVNQYKELVKDGSVRNYVLVNSSRES